MRQRLPSFKNSELATAIEAFSALGFHPGNDLVKVQRSKQHYHVTQAVPCETLLEYHKCYLPVLPAELAGIVAMCYARYSWHKFVASKHRWGLKDITD